MILRSVDQEVSRRKRQARERIILDILERAGAALKQLAPETYRKTVIRLAAEAMGRMPCREFAAKVSASPNDALESAALESEIAGRLRDRNDAGSIRVEVRTDLPPGVIVESGDDRLRWDNTFAARLRRLRTDIRRSVAALLFEKK